MSRKNGKKGFLKLSNENMAMMDREESGSEIELLDLTQLDHSQLPEHINERRCSSCSKCCLALYLLLMTVLFVFASLFLLYTAYDVHLLKKEMVAMGTDMDKMRKDLNDLQKSQLSHSKEFTLHISEISSLNSSITSLTSSMHDMSHDMAQLETKLNSIKQEAQQVDVNGMALLNNSLGFLKSSLSNLGTSYAHFNSVLNELRSQVTETKKYCGDFGSKIDAVTSQTAEAVDDVNKMKSNQIARASYVDSKLTDMEYFEGNITKRLDEIDWVTNTSLNDILSKATSAAQNVTKDHVLELEHMKNEIAELRQNLSNVASAVGDTPPIVVTPTETTVSSTETHSSVTSTNDVSQTSSAVGVESTSSSSSPQPTAMPTIGNSTQNVSVNVSSGDGATPTKAAQEGTKLSKAEKLLKQLIASFSQLDTNGNSNLSFVEFSHLINNSKVFNTLDRNVDGELTMDELLNSLEYIQNKQKVDKTPPDDTDYDKYEPSQ